MLLAHALPMGIVGGVLSDLFISGVLKELLIVVLPLGREVAKTSRSESLSPSLLLLMLVRLLRLKVVLSTCSHLLLQKQWLLLRKFNSTVWSFYVSVLIACDISSSHRLGRTLRHLFHF